MGRAYVPGHEHDLFLSYAHDEAEWVGAFRQSLDKAIRTRLGRGVSIWFDKEQLRAGDIWPVEIESAIKDAVALMAVCSPTYLERPYCHKECGIFRDHHGAADDVARLKDRLLKVIKTPALDGGHLDFFGEVQHVEFFGNSGDEFAPSSPEFESQTRQVAKWIAEILKRKRNAQTAIYLAQCAADMEHDWTSLAKQLEESQYNVTTVQSTYGGSRLKDHIDNAEWTVFLIGGVYDRYVERQLRMAIDLGKPIACWLHPVRTKEPGPEQKKLIDLIHSIESKHELFGHPSIRGVIGELQRLFDGAAEPEPAATTTGSVALLYDGTDAEPGTQIRKIIDEHKLTAVTPSTPDLSALMAACDGALLFHKAAPSTWLEQNFHHVYCADMLYRHGRDPLKARTFFVADPSPLAKYPGVDVIPFQGEVKPESLKPFFDRMRGQQMRSADAGR